DGIPPAADRWESTPGVALPWTLLPTHAAIRDCAEIHGQIRDAGFSTTRHKPGEGRGAPPRAERHSLSPHRMKIPARRWFSASKSLQGRKKVRMLTANLRNWAAAIVLGFIPLSGAHAQPPQHLPRWSEKQAADWYAKQPWLVGSNYIPATAINELEMWQAETFDPKRIDQELGWGQSIGLNSMRGFLHDLLSQ